MELPFLTRRGLIGTAGAAAAAAGAMLALHGSGNARRAAADPHMLVRGNSPEPDTLDPHLSSAAYENLVIGDMFLGLMTENAAGDPVPGAALGHEVSADGLVYRFHLRAHNWSDGVPVTAEDFAFSLRRAVDPKTAASFATFLYPIRNAQAINAGKLPPDRLGVRAIDERTLEIACDIEVPYIDELMMNSVTFPVPQHIVMRYGAGWTRPGRCVSNGPYMLTEWVPNDRIVLARNPHFYDAHKIAIERIRIDTGQDYSSALKRFRTGEIDIDSRVPATELPWIVANLGSALHQSPFLTTWYALFNTGRKPFDDLRVREALSLAIEREVIAERVMRVGPLPAYAFVPPKMPSYPGTAQIRFRNLPQEARLAKARALLGQAGFGADKPLAFDLHVKSDDDERRVAVALQAMWRDVGVSASIMALDAKDHYNALANQDFSVAWAAWYADFRDAKDFLMPFQSSADAGLNEGMYRNLAYDRLMDEADHTADPRARGNVLARAEQILLDDVALAPVCFDMSRSLVSPAVRGWVGNVLDIHRTRWLSLDRRAVA